MIHTDKGNLVDQSRSRMGEEELQHLINGCLEHDRKCQKLLYKAFYGYAMGICMRYANDREEASEVLNTGFFKVFNKLDTYKPAVPFKYWLGKIMVNVSIDFYRSNLKHANHEDIDTAYDIGSTDFSDHNLNYDDLLKMVQKLPPAYKLVFNLYAIEGFTHEEIADQLNINIGTSKSNLHKARQKLKAMILNADVPERKAGYYHKEDKIIIAAINNTENSSIILNKGIRE